MIFDYISGKIVNKNAICASELDMLKRNGKLEFHYLFLLNGMLLKILK